MDYNTILLFIISSISLTLLPGPDILFVVTTSISKGLKNGLKISLGLCSGLIIHTCLVILGLASLLQLFPEIFRAIEIFGAIYLVFIAYTILRINKKRDKLNERKESYFVTGFIMNLSNPKVSLFFISFFPGFLFSSTLSLKIQFAVLGSIFLLQALIIFCSVSFLSYYFGKRIKRISQHIIWNRIQAAILFLISVFLLYP